MKRSSGSPLITVILMDELEDKYEKLMQWITNNGGRLKNIALAWDSDGEEAFTKYLRRRIEKEIGVDNG